MSKTGVNSGPIKQENNPFKKDNRGPNDRRSDSFTSPGNKSGQHGHQNQAHNRDRDRSGNRNDNRQNDKGGSDTNKSNEKDEKTTADASLAEKKFTGRCRLFVGNLTPDVTEDDFKKMFEPYGEISEVYVNTSRGFGFIRLDYRQNAEAAKAGLDGLQRKGRILRVRFATHGAALRVKNLHPFVSNELLEQSFSQFGELERCIVIVDDRGKPTGEGIVEFVRKPGANSALRRITEGVFLIGADPKPVAVEPLEQKDEEDGLPEKFLTKTEQYKKEREKEPRFAPPGTFEYEFGMRWKQLEELEKQRIEQIKKDTEEARIKLEDEMQNALYEYQAEQIRQDLLRQQEELRRLEELRNKDRMRRQQDLEMRRAQDERERAQQEERRRADMMMSLRQQEIARGRGPMDSQAMRSREEMMMADRYGDRMPDRMPDRLGDRMPERMGDRMGPGQPGFMWDEKSRGEGGMRGEGGRGRDMRGSGAPPLQPPPVPPSAMGAMERGGPAAAAAAAAAVAQNAKSSPKPLMQGGGFGGMGGQQGGGGGPNNMPASEGGSAMDEDCTAENEQSQVSTAEVSADTEEPVPVCRRQATSQGQDTNMLEESADNSYSEIPAKGTRPSLETGTPDTVELWETDVDYRLNNSGVDVIDTRRSSSDISLPQSCNSNEDVQDVSRTISEAQDVDYRINTCKSPAHLSPGFAPNNTQNIPHRCQSEERYHSSSLVSDDDLSRPKSGGCIGRETADAFITCSNKGSSSDSSLLISEAADKDSESFKESSIPLGNSPGKYVAAQGSQLFTASDNLHDQDLVADSTDKYESSSVHEDDDDVNETTSNGRVVIQRYLSSDSTTNHPSTVIHSGDSYQSTDVAKAISLEEGYQCSTSPTPYLTSSNSQAQNGILHLQTSKSMDCYKFSPSTQMCSISEGVQPLNSNLNNTDSVGEQQTCSAESEFLKNQIGYQQTDEESDYKQSVEDYKSAIDTDTVDSGEYKQPLENGDEYEQMTEGDNESHYTQTDKSEAAMSTYQQSCSPSDVSSYKQHSSDEAEEMDTETLDEDDAVHVSVSPSVYQSYEEDLTAGHYQTAAIAGLVNVSGVAQNYGATSETRAWGSGASVGENIPLSSGSQLSTNSYSSSSTYTLTQNTMTEVASSSSKNHMTTCPSSSTAVSMSSVQPHAPGTAAEADHEAALCTGDQSFKTAAARQSALVPFMQPAHSHPYVSGVNPSMYAGPAVVQGMSGPTVMTSSSVHIAQHPSGATIMRHQSMSTGVNGGMAQATVLQQQAMPNGVQATAMLQQRTLTNGGQTMVVQQRTMTTGLGAMAQQTVVQQRMAAPGSVAQAAMLRANAMRQQAMATQQASIMQQRGVRLVQARVMGNSMLRAQTLGGAALIHRGGSPATLLGPGLVRGVSQGSVMQQLVRQRYLGGPVTHGRGIQIVAGRPVRVKMAYSREGMPVESNMS